MKRSTKTGRRSDMVFEDINVAVLSWGLDGWSWKSSMTVLVKADLCSIGPWLCLCEVLSSVSLCLLCSVSVYLVSPVCEIGNVKPSFPKIAKQLSETFLLPTYAD